MKTPHVLFSFGTVCILLSAAFVCLAVTIWKSCAFSMALFSGAILMSLVNVVLSLSLGRRSLEKLSLAIRTDIAAYLGWSGRMNNSMRRWFYWQLVHPMYWRLAHYWNIIIMRRKLVFAVVFIVVGLVSLVCFTMLPIYSSTCVIKDNWGW
jgi:hypothetical protein